MKRILDVYGHYAQYDDFYYLDDSFIGRVILKDDKTFEGIGESYYKDEYFLLFGNVMDNMINVYTVGGNDSFPRLYKGEKDGSKYYGSVYVTDGCLDLGIGECKLSVIDADKNREVTDAEFESIEYGIKCKKKSLSDKQRDLYENVVGSIYGPTMKTK